MVNINNTITKIERFEMNFGKVVDINLKTINDGEIKEFGRTLIHDNLVIVRKQDIDGERLRHICKTIGDLPEADSFFFEPEHPGIGRVTNKRVNGEKIGLFADKELDWHCNALTRKWAFVKECCIALHCVQPGIDSVTTFLDSRAVFTELSESLKEECRNLECWMEFENNRFYNLDEDDVELAVFRGDLANTDKDTLSRFFGGSWKPLVIAHPRKTLPRGVSGPYEALYLAEHTITKLRDKTTKQEFLISEKQELWDNLIHQFYQNQRIIDWRWESGDVLFSDQFLSFHKRNAVRGERYMRRAAFSYSNLEHLNVT